MPPLTIVAGLFVLSLLSAIVLFKFLQSTALIKNRNYQAGGAVAGFVIVYGVLHASYMQAANYTQTIAAQKEMIASQKDTIDKLQQFTKEVTLKGKVTPSEDTLVQIAAWETAPTDLSGAFSLKAPCLQGSDAKLIITHQGRYFMKYLDLGKALESQIDVSLPPQ